MRYIAGISILLLLLGLVASLISTRKYIQSMGANEEALHLNRIIWIIILVLIIIGYLVFE